MNKEQRISAAKERMLSRWEDRDAIEAELMSRHRGLSKPQLVRRYLKCAGEKQEYEMLLREEADVAQKYKLPLKEVEVTWNELEQEYCVYIKGEWSGYLELDPWMVDYRGD